jgi:hypothetical protein
VRAVAFLSGGPLVTLSVDGCEPGGTVVLSGPETVNVHATVRSISRRILEVVRNGEVVARAKPTADARPKSTRTCGSEGTRG